MKQYDVIIAGGGIAGAFAAYRFSKNRTGKACLIEFGRPPGKRRKQLEGWLGCFPTGNSRLYLNDVDKVKQIVNVGDVIKAERDVFRFLENYGGMKVTYPKKVSDSVKNKLDLLNYSIDYLPYIQWKPENVHLLSRGLSDYIETNENVDLCFDDEILNIEKDKDKFIVKTEKETYCSKKLILCLGRSGWRFNNSLLKKFDLIKSNDYATFGFMAEIPSGGLKKWNSSHCMLKRDNIEIGPLSWRGTVIPEDHCDLVISGWRSNENRWHTEKVSISIKIKEKFENLGTNQTERLAKLAFVLCDNRVGKIKISEYLNNGHDVGLIPEYNWIKNKMKEFNDIFPNLLTRGYMNIPDISLVRPVINVNSNLSTDADGLFVAGESANITGIISACLTGYIAAL